MFLLQSLFKSLSSYRCTYDVFLSFRGADTRKCFTDHHYSALELAGIHTLRDDDEIEREANIEQELQTAIQESRVSVIVFSKDYVSSRKQTGSFAEPFTRHEKRFKDEIDKVEEWRRALRDVADLGGMVLRD
ncbi:TMV resistance protein N-like [Pyrus communis]|uniref:TMV resistance protein N-like n=1 Tax=Pyrus communis TaxID=23211 RepID=UPI0035C1B447